MPNRSSAKRGSPLVVLAPFPPTRNGIADYVAELVPYHLADFDVTLVISDDAPIPTEPGPRVLLASEFRRHRSFFEEAPKIYHFGNNPDHCYLLDLIARDPGIVVLHDFNLGYLHEMNTTRWGDRVPYVGAMEREYGALGSAIVRQQFDMQYRENFASYEMPLNGRVLESATAVIVHSRQVQFRVAARVPQTPVWYVPHHLSPAVATHSSLGNAAAKRRFGLAADRLAVTAVGFVTRAKQISLTLAALAEIRGVVPPFRFILGGERRPDEYDVDADIARSGLADLTICTDYLDERRFFELLAATDVLVNLRHPSGGETSGTLVRALGMGVPTIVLDYGPIGELPPFAVRKIAWDDNVEASLATSLRELMTDANARRALGAGAASYVRKVHDIEGVARRYARIVRETTKHDARPRAVPARRYVSGARFVASRFQRARAGGVPAAALARTLWWRAPVPLGAPGERALVVSERADEAAELLSDIFEWDRSSIMTFSSDEFLAPHVHARNGVALSAGAFSLALLTISPDLHERDAALLLRRANAALQIDGRLLFEIRNPTEDNAQQRVSRPLSEPGITQRLEDAGFGDIQSISPQQGVIAELVLPNGNEVTNEPLRVTCSSARKVSEFVVWRYVEQQAGLPMRCGGRLGRIDSVLKS